MGTTISFSLQKGGVGKTTSAGIGAYLLSKRSRVLAVDFDPQGNLSTLLSQQSVYSFTGRNVLQACYERDPRPYIVEITKNLHLLPAEDALANLPVWLHREYKGDPSTVLRDTLANVKDQYDYLIIDLPPQLGDLSINGAVASDFIVVPCQTHPSSYEAVERFLGFLVEIKENANPNLMLAGILPTMNDSRSSLENAIMEKLRAEYGDYMFQSIIRRRSRINEFYLGGITEGTYPDREAMHGYKSFVEELKERVKETANVR